jgi:hypothetical protein
VTFSRLRWESHGLGLLGKLWFAILLENQESCGRITLMWIFWRYDMMMGKVWNYLRTVSNGFDIGGVVLLGFTTITLISLLVKIVVIRMGGNHISLHTFPFLPQFIRSSRLQDLRFSHRWL